MDNQDKQLRNWKAIAATSVVVALASVIVVLIIGVKGLRDSSARPATESSAAATEAAVTEITETEEVPASSEETEILKAPKRTHIGLIRIQLRKKKSKLSSEE